MRCRTTTPVAAFIAGGEARLPYNSSPLLIRPIRIAIV